MNCEQAKERLPDYLAGSIGGVARQEMLAHLEACEGCRQDAEAWAALGSMRAEQPGPELRERFDAMLAAYQHGVEAERARRPRFSLGAWLESWWPQRPAWQFAVAMACLVVGLGVGRYATQGPQQPAPDGEIARLREEVHNTRQMVAVSLLQQQSATDRLRGVDWSYRLQQPDTQVLGALLDTVKHDDSVDVRLAAVDALRRYAAEPMVRQGLIGALRGKQSPLVQIALIDAMVELRERDAAPLLEELKSDKAVNEAVRQRADWALQKF
jgi:hypothetical protein